MAINNDFRVKNGLYVGEDINALRGSVSALTYYGKLFDVGVAGAGGSGSTDVLSGQDTLTFEAVSGVNVTVSDGNLKFNLDVSSSFEINTNTLDLTDTGVSAGAYGSSTQIPVVTVDAQGRVTSLTATDVQASVLSASDGSNNIEIDLGSETFSIVGTSLEVETAASGNQIQIGLPDDVTIGNDLTVTGNLTVNGTTTTLNTTVTATTSAVENNFVIESTDDGASAAPDLKLYRNSSSPAASDQVGDIIFTGKNSAAEDVNYGHIYGTIVDAVDGTEDGLVRLGAISGGTMDDTLSIRSGKVGIGTSNPNEKFTVSGALSASADSYINTLVIGNAGNANNTIIGKCGSIGTNITTGNSNTLLGMGASQALTTGSKNVSIGFYVNHYNTTGSANITLGSHSNYSSGGYNIVLGNNTWQNTNASGNHNIVMGYGIGGSATSAERNVILGYSAGKNITSGYDNVFLGKSAGYSFTTGYNNIAIGDYAEPGNNSYHAISLGKKAGNYNFDGTKTVSIGYCAGNFAAASQCSVNIGSRAGIESSGINNVHVGSYAGYRNRGADNIAIGYCASSNSAACTVTNSIVIGTNQRNIGSNTAIIGNSSMTTAVISATNVGIGKSNPSVPLDVSGAFKTDSTVTFSGLSTGTSNNVLILDGSNNVVYDEINSAVWDTSSTFLKGQGTASHVAFFTASDTLSSEATGELYWDSSNNKLGINTATPNEAVTVSGALSATSDSYINTLVIGNAGCSNSVIVGKCGAIGGTGSDCNTFIGTNVFNSLSAGSGRHVGIGINIGQGSTGGDENIAIGHDVLRGNEQKGIFIGSSTWTSTSAAGGYNVVIGYNQNNTATTSYDNVLIGRDAGSELTTGSYNVMIGLRPGYHNAQEISNVVAIGNYANVGASSNQSISIGHRAASYTSDQTQSISMGYYGGSVSGASKYSINLGTYAGNQSCGDNNIHLGCNAGRRNQGADNIAIGRSASSNSSACTVTNSIVIGAAQSNIGSNTTIIGNSSMTTAVISAGKVGIGNTTPNEVLTVTGNISSTGTVYADAFESKSGNGSIDFNDNVDMSGTMVVSGAATFTNDVTIGDASGDTLTINSATINPVNIAAGTDNTVVIYNGSTLVTDEINSAVWDTTASFLKGQGTASHVAFFTATDTLSSEATGELYWDSSNNKLGINTATPNEAVTVSGALSATSDSYINTLVVGNAGNANNVIVGKCGTVGSNITTGDKNVLLGTGASPALTTGSCNVSIGYCVNKNATTKNGSITIGSKANYSSGFSNIAIGNLTLQTTSSATNYNITIGYANGNNLTTGCHNILMGYGAGCSLTTGCYNVFLGGDVGRYSVTGYQNVAIGKGAEPGNGTQNAVLIGAAVGYYAYNQTGSVSIGDRAGVVRADSRNSINIGYYAGNNSSGDGNVHLGKYAGRHNRGADNIAIGNSASCNSSACTITNSIVIGTNQSNIGSNTTIIGNSSMTTAVISAGKVGIGNTTPNEVLTVTGNISSTGTVYADAFESKSGNGSIDFNDNVDMSGTMVVSGAATFTNDVTIGDASGDTLTIKSATINPENIAAGTDDTVVIYNGSTLVTDEINSKVWDTAATFITGTGTDNRLANFNGTDALDASQLSDDGTTVTIGVSQTNPVVIEPTSTTTSVKYGNGTSGFHSICTTVGASTSAVVASFPHADYRSGKVVVQSSVNSAQYEAAEILVVHDGTTVCGTEYGNITTGSTFCVSYEARINGSNVELVATNACAASSDVVVAVTQLANT